MINLVDSSKTVQSFYIIRHGESGENNAGRILNAADTGLNSLGVEEAESASAFLAGLKIDAIFSSPLAKAVQTADIIAKGAVLPTYFKHSGLTDKKEGDWEGKTYWELRDQVPKLWEAWSKDPINFCPPEGESVVSFVARVGRALADIRQNYKIGNNVVFTTHEGVVRALLILALEIPVNNFFRLDVPTGSVTQIDWSDDYATVKFMSCKPEITVPMTY